MGTQPKTRFLWWGMIEGMGVEVEGRGEGRGLGIISFFSFYNGESNAERVQ